MGSKFSQKTSPQKPPPVCIKPPSGDQYTWPPFNEIIFQGHVDFYAPFSPYEGGFGQYFHMTPDPPNKRWTVMTGTDVNQVQIRMDWFPVFGTLDFELKCFSGDVLEDTYTMTDVVPRSLDPFDTGLLYPDPGPPGGHLRFRILA